MIALALCSMLIGSALGIRFRFVILPPVILIGTATLVAISTAQGAPLAQAIWTVVVFASLLQFGYICSALFKHAVMPACANPRETVLGGPKLRS